MYLSHLLKSRGHPPDPAALDPDLNIPLLFWSSQPQFFSYLAPITTRTLYIQLLDVLNWCPVVHEQQYSLSRQVKPLQSTQLNSWRVSSPSTWSQVTILWMEAFRRHRGWHTLGCCAPPPFPLSCKSTGIHASIFSFRVQVNFDLFMENP